MGYTFHASNDYCNNINIPARAVHYIMFFMACLLQLILYSPHSRVLKVLMVGWLVEFYVPSTARSFRDGTPFSCPKAKMNPMPTAHTKDKPAI